MYTITPDGSSWENTVNGFNIGDKIQGDPGGLVNIPLQQLADRTEYLYNNLGGGGTPVTEVDDSAPVSSTTKVWSISKIDSTYSKLTINDSSTSNTETWSSNKIDSEIDANKLTINDSSTSNTETWSSNKINSEITANSGKLNWSIQNTTYTASANEGIFADTSAAPWTLSLPASPSIGDTIRVSDIYSSWDTNNLTISGNGNNIENDSNLVCDVENCGVMLVYTGDASVGWKVM